MNIPVPEKIARILNRMDDGRYYTRKELNAECKIISAMLIFELIEKAPTYLSNSYRIRRIKC